VNHLVCNPPAVEFFSFAVWGASSPAAGLLAERSFWHRADVLIFSGSRGSLEAVRFAFSLLPGRFASGVVRGVDWALAAPPRQLPLC